MPIQFTCPACQASINAPDAAAGKRAPCPRCKVPIVIPRKGASAGPAPVEVEPADVLPVEVEPVESVEPVRPARSAGIHRARPTAPGRPPVEDDDPGDPDDDYPARRRDPVRRRPFPWLAVALAGGVLLLGLVAAGVGVLFYLDASRQAQQPVAKVPTEQEDVTLLKGIFLQWADCQASLDGVRTKIKLEEAKTDLAKKKHEGERLDAIANTKGGFNEKRTAALALAPKHQAELKAIADEIKRLNGEEDRLVNRKAVLRAEGMPRISAVLERRPQWRTSPPAEVREPLRQLGLAP
jgi:hypothetical protein